MLSMSEYCRKLCHVWCVLQQFAFMGVVGRVRKYGVGHSRMLTEISLAVWSRGRDQLWALSPQKKQNV